MLSTLKNFYDDLTLFGITSILTWLLLLFTVLSYLDTKHYLLDLFSHFRVQLFVLAFIATVTFGVLKKYFGLVLALGTAMANAVSILPYYLVLQSPSLSFKRAELSVLLSNVLTRNTNKQALIELVRRVDPDLLVLLEIDEQWVQALREIEADYSENIIEARADNFGVAIYSKYPLTDSEVLTWGGAGLPSIKTKLLFDGNEVSIIATHPLPPIGKLPSLLRNDQLSAIAEHVSNFPGELIVLGDFNVTMWSSVMQQFEEKSELVNARRGFGILPTWPSFMPLLLIPIDHCFVSSSIEVVEMRRERYVGSDHYPLFIKLKFGGDSPSAAN